MDADSRVFLLSTRASSVGINLTAANHVMLFDVTTNVSLENQAIGRAWRMGQTRPVRVVRYIMHNSVESRLHDLRRGSASQNGSTLNAANIEYLLGRGWSGEERPQRREGVATARMGHV